MSKGPHIGYKQSSDHIEKRKRFREQHHGWKGDQVSVRGGRVRAIRWFKDIGPCENCGNSKAQRHHKDNNTANNDPDNIQILCMRCHEEIDGRLDMLRQMAKWSQPLAVQAKREYEQKTL